MSVYVAKFMDAKKKEILPHRLNQVLASSKSSDMYHNVATVFTATWQTTINFKRRPLRRKIGRHKIGPLKVNNNPRERSRQSAVGVWRREHWPELLCSSACSSVPSWLLAQHQPEDAFREERWTDPDWNTRLGKSPVYTCVHVHLYTCVRDGQGKLNSSTDSERMAAQRDC